MFEMDLGPLIRIYALQFTLVSTHPLDYNQLRPTSHIVNIILAITATS